ncbi:MAG: hypothetical protein O2822_07750 [Chloroflexi bacterium]|nr:hypothetical protein [Chloroflexota bacterium]
MASCPIHIWVPLMAAAVPFSRAIRDRVKLTLAARRAQPADAPARELHRWAPVGQTTAPPEGSREQ